MAAEIFSGIIEMAPYGVFIADKDGIIKYVNEKICEMSGYTFVRLIGESIGGIIGDPDEDDIKTKTAGFMDSVNNRVILPVRTLRDGVRQWKIESIFKDGNIISFAEDVTEAVNSSKDSAAHTLMLGASEMAGSSGSLEIMPGEEIIRASAGASRLFGFAEAKSEKSIAEFSRNLLNPTEFSEAIKGVAAGKSIGTISLRVRNGEGKNERILLFRAKAVPPGQGDEVISASCFDATDFMKEKEALCRERNSLRKYIDSTGSMIVVLDATGRAAFVNRACRRILGYAPEDMLGRLWVEDFIPRGYQEAAVELTDFESLEKQADHNVSEHPVITASGEWKNVLWHAALIKDDHDNEAMAVLSGEDATERRNILDRLAKSENALKKAEKLNRSGYFEYDFSSGKCIWSEGLLDLLGDECNKTAVAEVSGIMPFLNQSGMMFENAVHDAIRKKNDFELDVKLWDRTGNELSCLLKCRIYFDGRTPVRMLGTVCDISGRKEQIEEIEYISYHDHLTGLYNRRYLEEEFNRLDVRRNYPFSVIMADVNGLKLTNDSFGHGEGDALLISTAEILKGACRQDEIIARVGGDEFMILLPNTGAADAKKIMERVSVAADGCTSTGLPLSIGLGHAVKTDSRQDRDDLFKAAEDAMYRDKLRDHSKKRKEAIDVIFETLCNRIEWERDHAEKVGEICGRIGKAMKMKKNEIARLRFAGLYHDIGKIAVREDLLKRAGKLLKEDEIENIRRHAETGYRILSSSNDTADLAEPVLSHHERWDGQGYPRGLKEEEIPLQSRIIAIADAYDAMVSKRPFRKEMPQRRIYSELRKNSGRQFDPALVKLFISEIWPAL
ncbi:MAG: diguanylate cyclase [Clostridia bacterium]|nr:diguanylate cyclase [Clostridia bacterium]